MTDERKAFEAWASEQHPEWAFTSDPVFDYHNERTRCAWEGWSARASLPQPAAAQGEPEAYVPYCHTDGERCIQGEYKWDEVAEKPFECNDPENWMCAPLYASPAVRLSDSEIVAIRDEHLPSQGESFDCIAFARAVLAAAAPKTEGDERG